MAPDHPHVRGEQDSIHEPIETMPGPPPCARGADHREFPAHAPPGTIPACARSRDRRPGPRCCSRDHPRVRGERLARLPTGLPTGGPSTQMRGAVGQGLAKLIVGGLIPAGMGAVMGVEVDPSSQWAHPHGYREQYHFCRQRLKTHCRQPRTRTPPPAPLHAPAGISPSDVGADSRVALAPARSC